MHSIFFILPVFLPALIVLSLVVALERPVSKKPLPDRPAFVKQVSTKPLPGVRVANVKVDLAPSSSARGVRNFNPGNIEYGPFARSMGATGTDRRFATFKNSVDGIAAMSYLLITYQKKHQLLTPVKMIERWAPHFENDVNSYARIVARIAGIGAKQRFSMLLQPVVAQKVIAGMIRHENGYQPYSAEKIHKGYLRGVRHWQRTRRERISKSRTSD